MTDKEQRAAAEKFAADWKDKGYEKGQSQGFWLSLLRDVYGVAHPDIMLQLLLKAHRELDRVVMELYGFSVKDMDEAACVAALMERYLDIVG